MSNLVNPHAAFSAEWYVWKEKNEGWLPYHVGKTPSGQYCSSIGRCYIVRPGVYRCGKCGKEFPTWTAIEEEAFQVILTDCRKVRAGLLPCDSVGYYDPAQWPAPVSEFNHYTQAEMFHRAEQIAISEAFGYPVRLLDCGQGNGRGTWKIERDTGPVCGSDPTYDCRDLRMGAAIELATALARSKGDSFAPGASVERFIRELGGLTPPDAPPCEGVVVPDSDPVGADNCMGEP